jgi:hypothetical protein
MIYGSHALVAERFLSNGAAGNIRYRQKGLSCTGMVLAVRVTIPATLLTFFSLLCEE